MQTLTGTPLVVDAKILANHISFSSYLFHVLTYLTSQIKKRDFVKAHAISNIFLAPISHLIIISQS